MTRVKVRQCRDTHQRQYHRTRAATLAAVLTLALSGCEVVSTVSGVAAGVASGTVTGNPAVGASVAIAVKAGVDEAGKTILRRSQQAEQDAIVTAAGTTRVGETGTWQIRHRMTRAVEHGDVRVVRLIETPLAICKELLFSVVQGEGEKESRAWYRTNACHDGEQWKWALVEPAVSRWGTLQ
ncbi:MAG: hypothetical protein ACXWC3_13150 [Burkholderiales bacterium]